MKYIILFSIVFLFSNCDNKKTYEIEAQNNLEETEIDIFKSKIIHYVGRLPKKANHSNKFDEKFVAHYKELAYLHDLVYYYPDTNSDTIYFLMTRIAPSLHLKKVAIAGKVVINENREITYFEETFRTFKMEEDLLLSKSNEMFITMIEKENLKHYEFEHTLPEEYIEFPDVYTFYDSNERQWVSTRENPLGDLKKEFKEQVE